MRDADDFRDEIEAHIALEVDRLIAEGRSPVEARSMALKRFGNVTGARERYHDSRRLAWLDDLRADIRYALRSLRRAPGFATVAILTLALAIGANTAIFSVINAVLLRPLPYPDADRLFTVIENRPASEPFDMRPPRRSPLAEDMRVLRQETRTLSHVEQYGPGPEIRIQGREDRRGIVGVRASGPLLTMLGARPVLGRLYTEDERTDPVVVLNYRLWQREFASDPQIIGRTVILSNGNLPDRRTSEPHTVIGVLADGFAFPDANAAYWMPLGGATNLVRLRDGVTLEAAAEEVSAILHRAIDKPRPAPGAGPPRFELVGLQDGQVAQVRPALRMLAVAVGVLLLIACANMANLLLLRAGVRRREIAVRAALGAGRGRLVRQLLSESLTLSLLGGIAGIGLAFAGLETLRRLLASFTLPAGRIVRQIGVEGPVGGFPRLEEIALDLPTLLFTLGLSVMTGVLFGLAPALQQWRRRAVHGLRDGADAGGLRLVRRNVPRAVLVVAQVGMAMALLVAGGLMVHSFVRLLTVDRGYDGERVLTFQIRRPPVRSRAEELLRLSEALAPELARLPGVAAASYSSALPMVQLRINNAFRTSAAEQLPPSPDGPVPASPYFPDIRVVGPGYFQAMGIRLIAGRTFTDAELQVNRRAVIVNREFARTRLGGANPVGRQLFTGADEPWDIVGLVADVRQEGVDRTPDPQIFIGFRQSPMRSFASSHYYMVRTEGDPYAVVPAIRQILQRHDREATLEQIATMEELEAFSTARPRTYATLLALFAGVAVTLAAIGVYGVVAYAVTQSTREIGIRLALGAERRAIERLVVGQGMTLVAAGSAVGVVMAVSGSQLLDGLVFGLTPLDAPTYAAVVVLFAGVAAVAAYVPARRATRVSAVVALRSE